VKALPLAEYQQQVRARLKAFLERQGRSDFWKE